VIVTEGKTGRTKYLKGLCIRIGAFVACVLIVDEIGAKSDLEVSIA
jgi:hypothetical protein